jgi:hypothetical protein
MATTATETAPQTCFLYEAAGLSVPCQRERCSFWERGECVPERLGLQSDMDSRPDLASWLLALRSELSSNALEVPGDPLPPYNLLSLPGFRR